MKTMETAALAAAGLALASAALAQEPLEDPIPEPIPKGDIMISLRTIASGLAAPNWLTTAPDGSGRLFVVDQPGTIRIIENGKLLPTPFLDMSDMIVELGVFGTQDENDFDERGLLGLAFHPDFAKPGTPGFGKLYTYSSEEFVEPGDFTTPVPPPKGLTFNHQSVVREWQVDPANPNMVDPASSRGLMRIDQPQFNHNAGWLDFGPDGLLYIALGDGGGADDEDGQPFIDGLVWGHGEIGNGQNINSVHGSILRIDPLGSDSANGQYGVPADNPFVGADGIDEIFAFGFRNPFRNSFHPATGQLIVADVGQNDIEEIDLVELGGNYGWRLKEGSFKFVPNGPDDGFVTDDLSDLPPDLIDPVAEYDHDEGIAIVGGFIYTGSLIPELAGKYVFGDFSLNFFSPEGRLFYADLDTGEIFEFILGIEDNPLGLFVKGFGQDENGELYLLAGTNLGPFGDDGVVLRIVPAPGPAALVLIGALAASRRRRQR